MSIQLMNYQSDNGRKTILLDDGGRKWIHILIMDGGLCVKKVSSTEGRYMTAPTGKAKAISTVVRQYRAYGNRTGMTKAAKSFLTKANRAA